MTLTSFLLGLVFLISGLFMLFAAVLPTMEHYEQVCGLVTDGPITVRMGCR